MANLFLDEYDSVTVQDGNMRVWGSSGNENVNIVDAANTFIDQNIETISFNQVLSDYTMFLMGNILTVNLNLALAAQITIGISTKLTFKDGSAGLQLTGLGTGILGGAFISSTEGKVNGATLDNFDSCFAAYSCNPELTNTNIDINAEGLDNSHPSEDLTRSENVEDGNYIFNFTQGNYEYNIQGFSDGDKLNFPTEASITINNAAADGQLSLTAFDQQTDSRIIVTLSGISVALDSTIFNVDTFNAAFGTSLLG